MSTNPKRIIIIGSAGSGKSTLAISLQEKLQIPLIHLDKYYWQSGWIVRQASEWEQMQKGFIEGDEWIIDGNYGKSLEMRMNASTHIIFLDLNRFVCLLSIIKRRIQNHGKTRIDMQEGCTEKIDWEFIKWVWNFPKRSRPNIVSLLNAHQDKKIITIKSRKETKKFLITTIL